MDDYNTCLIVNTGSSDLIKAFTVSELHTDSPIVVPVRISDSIIKSLPEDASHKENAKYIAGYLSAKVRREHIGFVLFRCPAIKRNVTGLTFLDEEMAQELPNIRILEHGAEKAFWIAYEIWKECGVPAVFSCGIPTNTLSLSALMTGHPEINNQCLSHYEAVKGTFFVTGEEAFVEVVLGSGAGVYACENGRVVDYAIRHHDGPPSQSSMGGIDCMSILEWLEGKDPNMSVKEARRLIGKLSGKTGGFQLYNPDWGELKNFRYSVEDSNAKGHAEAYQLFNAWVGQIVTRIGQMRASMGSFVILLNKRVPLYFTGGGANWDALVDAIKGRTETVIGPVFSSYEVIEEDVEMVFFIHEAQKFAKSGKAMSFADLKAF